MTKAQKDAEKTVIKGHLKTVLRHFDEEDRAVREAQLRMYRRLKLYWNNFSQIYWSETARDYRIYQGGNDSLNDIDTDQDYYDKPINVFRAFLETIIAALSIQIPGVSCAPDDADNPNDITTAKAGDQIAQLIYKHNDAVFLWLYALYVHMTEGMVACYCYEKSSKEYGTYQEKQFRDEQIEAYACPNCGIRLPDDILAEKELNEFNPDDEDAELHSILKLEGPVCPECAAELDPDLQKSKLIVPKFVGMTDKPKSRVCFDIHGGLYIKIANYAKDQKGTPYLIKSYETHYAIVLEEYKDLWDEMPQGGWTNTGVNDPYEQYARLNPIYRNSFPEEQVTVKEGWLRPAAFNILKEDESELLHKHFPDGVKVVLVNDICADYYAESLDDCWTLTKNPLHDYLNHDPLGELITNVQDITNDLISLTLQTIEHGIEQTWADPAVVNFEGQSQIEAMPGTLTPTKLQGGDKNLSNAFYSTKAASLSPEVFQFYNIIQQLGQFVSGALPSVFGGQMQSGSSRTASEYALSRSMALQRLQTPWKMFSIWWKEIFGKAIPTYIKIVKEDERHVMKDDNGNFYNVWIRKAELTGKIGSVELESSETLPISDEQKADMVMRLMDLNNQEIISALTSPENLPFIRKIVKMPEFVLPGEDDRTNEYEIITEMQGMEPQVQQPDPLQMQMAMMQTGMPAQPIELPAIPVDPDIDNSEIGRVICRSWLISEAGKLAKIENPSGYKNVLLRLKQHNEIFNMQQQQMMQQQMIMNEMNNANKSNQSQQQPKQAKSPKKDSDIDEVSDVRTPVQ